MKPKLIHLLLVFLLLLSLLPSACSVSSPINDQIEITDTTGHTIQLSERPQRIVVAGKAIIMIQDAVYLFPEAGQRVVGLENRKQSAFAFLPVVDDSIPEIATLEANAGPEQIAAFNPDLVLMKSYLAEQFHAPLQDLGIPSLYLDLETPSAFYKDIEALGQVFGNPDRAQEIIDFYRGRVARVEESLVGLDDSKRPRVLLIEYSDKGGEIAFYVPPASWIQTSLVEMAGGDPIWTEKELGDGWTIVSFEQIAAWDPDQIYLIDYSGNANQVVKTLKEDALWTNLSAVQNDQIYAFAFDFYSWDQPDTRWILGLQWLATKTHPELTSDVDILAEVEEFYAKLYRLDDSTIEGEIKPLLSGDIP